MKIGLTFPVYSNWTGLADAINSIVTDLVVKIEIVPTCINELSVAAGWNAGCRRIFNEQRLDYAIISNDDVIYPKYLFDVLLDLFKYVPANTAILTPGNVRDNIALAQNIRNVDCREVSTEELVNSFNPHPDFACFMLTKEAWETVGEFDENFERAYLEDNDFAGRIVLSGLTALSCNLPYYHIGCYDADTEILTEDGFKLFKVLTPEDKVASLVEGKYLEFVKPTSIMVYDYEGEMYKFGKRTLDLLVTPNHNMYVSKRGESPWEFVQAKDLPSQVNVPSRCIWDGGSVLPEYFVLPAEADRKERKIKYVDWLGFLGWFLSEGSIGYQDTLEGKKAYTVSIAQNKNENKEKIEAIITALGYTPKFYSNKEYIICDMQLARYLTQFGRQHERYIPKEVKKLSADALQVLFTSLIAGDGSVNKKTKAATFSTCSKQLADDIYEIGMKLGFSPSLYFAKPKAYPSQQINGRQITTKRDRYSVYFSSIRKFKTIQQGKNVDTVRYSGKVYCCEVPSHVIYVRRNGKGCWCGNSVTQNADLLNNNPRVPGDMFNRNVTYFKAKWGCNSVNDEEMMKRVYYKTPFNDPDLTLKDW